MEFGSTRVLITGGTGSFGNRVAEFLLRYNPAQITIFSRDEKKQYEMQKSQPDFRYILGDVRDKSQLDLAMRGTDIVFHAAALKQVPSCEIHPLEAVKTNILGSENVCRSAKDFGVSRVVALSTDKAVKPINAMGISKAMMEKIVISQNMTQTDTIFSCVRYGNVMGSRGSVIPLFMRQISKREQLTITDPKMTRFLMTLDQSVELVHYAFGHATGGETFIKKAPACSVIDLARAILIKYSDGDMDRINIVGVRPGEKMDEVLVNEYEIQRAQDTDAFFSIPAEYVENKPNNKFPFGYEYTSANTEQITDPKSIGMLLDAMGNLEAYK